MRVFKSVRAFVVPPGLLALALLAAPGCGEPEKGSQMQATPDEIAARGKGIDDAMKAGAYDIPRPPGKQ